MNSKKVFLPIVLSFLLAIMFIPFTSTVQASECASQTGIVRCGQETTCPCDFTDFFAMLARIYNFIVVQIASPLAVIALIIGGIMIMASGANPNLLSNGKTIMYSAIIGLILVFCSWLIIDFILKTVLGYTGTWSSL